MIGVREQRKHPRKQRPKAKTKKEKSNRVKCQLWTIGANNKGQGRSKRKKIAPKTVKKSQKDQETTV